MQKWDPMELNFEGLEMQKMKYINGQSWQSRWEEWVHLSSYHVALRVMVIKMTKWLVFVFSANVGKKVVTVWAKYKSPSERSYWVLSENDLVNALWL